MPAFAHVDDELRPLWKAIGESRVGGFDSLSLSPPPDNDTGPGDVVRM